MTGRFIVIEGIDGSGKTTQIKHLAWWLPRSGLMPPNTQLICTREPGGTSLGQCIRQILLHTSAEDSPQSRAELLLYAADRAQHVDTLILPVIFSKHRVSGSTRSQNCGVHAFRLRRCRPTRVGSNNRP